MLSFKFSHRSESHWADIRSRLESASFTVRAGVIGDEAYEDGTTVAEVAAFSELGTSSAPARPFISPAMRQHRAEAAELMAAAVRTTITGEGNATPQALGERMVEWIRQRILSGPFAPLAASTVRRKGHSHPLLDTLLLYDSIAYEVVS